MNVSARALRPAGCPTELALHQLVTGEHRGLPAEEVLKAHVRGCAHCGTQISRLETLTVPAPDPAFWAAMASSTPRRSRPLALFLAGAATVGAIAAIGIFLLGPHAGVPTSPSAMSGGVGAPDVRFKGALALGLLARRASGGSIPSPRAASGAGRHAPV